MAKKILSGENENRQNKQKSFLSKLQWSWDRQSDGKANQVDERGNDLFKDAGRVPKTRWLASRQVTTQDCWKVTLRVWMLAADMSSGRLSFNWKPGVTGSGDSEGGNKRESKVGRKGWTTQAQTQTQTWSKPANQLHVTLWCNRNTMQFNKSLKLKLNIVVLSCVRCGLITSRLPSSILNLELMCSSAVLSFYNPQIPQIFHPPSLATLFLHFLKHSKHLPFFPLSVFFLLPPRSRSTARLEVNPLPSVSSSAGEGVEGKTRVALTHPPLIISLRRLSEQTAITKVSTPLPRPCLCVQYGRSSVPSSMCKRASMSVLIVLGWIRLISDSLQRPAMTCLPHIPHCPLNTDERCLPVLVCIWNYQMFTHPCLMNADSKYYYAMQTTSMTNCAGKCCDPSVWSLQLCPFSFPL